MDELVNWYWDHGIKRGYDENDPDRELRKISIGEWLDPVVQILDRDEAIQSNLKAKACLALWGPSQTGKSTMMSRYIDGDCDDGTDSALTWSDDHKVRFSPPKEGMDHLQLYSPDTLVFNPYNHQSDASGVATRYTLQSAADTTVNPDFPIEVKFTTRVQLIQSLSLGYLSECKKMGEHFVYTRESFMDEIPEGTPEKKREKVVPEAYWLLKDIANVIEFMKGNERFANLFKTGEWNKKIRRKLVSSPELLSSVEAVEKFMAKIFWDSADILTDLYRKAEKMLNQLKEEWRGCKILATMEVGSLLLDIDSFRSYVSPEGEKGEKIKEKISLLAYEKLGDEIHISLHGGSKISGDEFGYFQAICAELNVPLKKENLERDFTKNSPFIELAEKCDFLDFPGVSNKNVGNNVADENAALVDLEKANLSDIFTKVFKQGKTQCFVYSYAKKYGIDAFAILVRTDHFPAQSSILNAGVGEWFRSFDPDWVSGRPADMPVFVDMTFFATLINGVALNGVGSGLSPYVNRIQELAFARRESAHFFATTYPQFPGGKIENPSDYLTIPAIMKDPVFVPATGLSEENIRAVYESDGGVDYMLKSMAQMISPVKRLDRCRAILDKDRCELLRFIGSQLPSGDDAMADDRKKKLRECLNKLERELSRIEDLDDASEYRKLAAAIKSLLSAPSSIFAPIKLDAFNLTKKEIMVYVAEQLATWFSYKVANLDSSDYFTTEQKQTILAALRDSFDGDSLFRMIKSNLGQIDNQVDAAAARFPFALAFGNLLQYGLLHIESNAVVGDCNPLILDTFIQATIDKDSERRGSPYYRTIFAPFISRLEAMSENSVVGARPPQDGDVELKAIFDKINASQTYKIC